jgi:predicted nucleic acid-binding protein
MNDRVFVDTGAWFAVVVPWDANHEAASIWFGRNESPLVTTDYVLAETLTLLRARGENGRAAALGERLFSGDLAALHFLSPDEIRAAWQVFRRFRDKEWSFTDCTSKVAMEQLGCSRAAAFDEHFRQFGTVIVEP